MLKKTLLTGFGLVFLVSPLVASADQIADLRAQIQSLLAQISALKAQMVAKPTASPIAQLARSSACPQITRTLSLGARGDDVIALQNFLIAKNLFSANSATDYFGRLTQLAVQRWQSQNGIVSAGSPATTGYGVVGARTRAAIGNCDAPSTPLSVPPTTQTPPNVGANQGSSLIPPSAQDTVPPVAGAVTNTTGSNSTAGSNTAQSSAPMTYLLKRTLIFSLDQAFGNGIVANQDSTGLQRVILSLQAFRSSYEVYALVSANHADKSKLDVTLSALSAANIPFVLDVYTSDALSVGTNSVNFPYDITHGRTLSITQLQQYKTTYGNMFAGVRVFETFGTNAQVVGCQQLNANWCDRYKQHLPSDAFFQKKILEDYVKFAKDKGMFLLFSDHYWSVYATDTNLDKLAHQAQNEQDLRDLATAYPGTIVVAFANNEWNEAARTRIDTWQNVVQPYVASSAKGFGLSNQSWMCNDENCPASELANWVTRAFARGAILVETEPLWYWWQFPKGIIGAQAGNYTTDTTWVNRGYPTANLRTLADTLGIALPSSLQAPQSAACTFNGQTVAQAQSVTAYHSSSGSQCVSEQRTCTNGTLSGSYQYASCTVSQPALAAPAGLRSSCNFAGTQATLAWDLSASAASYWFRVIGISQSQCTANAGWQWTSAEGGTCYPNPDSGLNTTSISFPTTADTPYAWKVQASTGQTFSQWATGTFSCAAPALNSFSISPASCISGSVASNAATISWSYALPANSWVNVGLDANYSGGHYSKSISGLQSTVVPDGLQLSTNGSALQVQSGTTYYVSLYDGALQFLTPNKTFAINACN